MENNEYTSSIFFGCFCSSNLSLRAFVSREYHLDYARDLLDQLDYVRKLINSVTSTFCVKKYQFNLLFPYSNLFPRNLYGNYQHQNNNSDVDFMEPKCIPFVYSFILAILASL